MPSSRSSRLHSSSVAASLPTARIVRRRDCTDDLFLLWLEPSIKFHFTPGQYVTLGAGGIERPYSIASAPYEPTIELFIEYVLPEYGGRLTPLLYAQHVGDSLTMRPKAKGRFTRRTGVTNRGTSGALAFAESRHAHLLVRQPWDDRSRKFAPLADWLVRSRRAVLASATRRIAHDREP
jgi:hypothetical protein